MGLGLGVRTVHPGVGGCTSPGLYGGLVMWIDCIDGELDQILDFAKVSEIPVIRGIFRNLKWKLQKFPRNPELPCQCLPHSPGAGNPGRVGIKNLPEPGLR